MLVLSRKKHERILIGEDIEVVVVEVRGDKVRLGITAPEGVRVMRPEAIVKQKKAKRAELMPPRPSNQSMRPVDPQVRPSVAAIRNHGKD